MSSITTHLTSLTNVSQLIGTPYMVSVYSTNLENDLVETSKTKAFSIWMYNGKNYSHYYFKNVNGTFKIDESLTKQSNLITFTMLDVLHSYSFSNAKELESSSCYIFRGDLNIIDKYKDNNDGELIKTIIEDKKFNLAHKVIGVRNHLLKKSWKKQQSNLQEQEDCVTNYCGENPSSNGDCRINGGGDVFICYVKEEQDDCLFGNIAIAADSFSSYSENDFLWQKAYDFRDNFLSNSIKGQDYINYYYLISYFTKFDNIDASEIPSYISFLHQLYGVIDRLEASDCNAIVSDNSFKTTALSFINEYKTKSTDLNFQNALTAIENDLNSFVGLTKSQIFAMLNLPCTGGNLISTINEISNINCYPNPTSNNITLQVNSDKIKFPITISIKDIYGKTLEIIKSNNKNTNIILGSKYLNGQYAIVVVDRNNIVSTKQFQIAR
jgi:hypothetical protein